jgi:D-glycero-alpha-D-manno-heptose-7-phosphate kinase
MPLRTIVVASAPTRVCDCGGWTDTWFARSGAVFHIAVEPRVEVRATARPQGGAEARADVEAPDVGGRFVCIPGRRPFGAHPLIEAAIESVGLPPGCDASVSIRSDMPPGASTGTSGALCVALVGALRGLAGVRITPLDIAREAHAVETDRLGQQSGVQDQIAAAAGGINFVEILGYPRAEVTSLAVRESWRDELEARLLLVYLGRSHSSSAIHESVIRDAVATGSAYPPLEDLRRAARDARDAALATDFAALGAAMMANTEAQRRLHPALIGTDATRVIELATRAGALGWKVNGAGGEGGSIVLLAASANQRDTLAADVAGMPGDLRVIPIRLARTGLTVTSMPAGTGPG